MTERQPAQRMSNPQPAESCATAGVRLYLTIKELSARSTLSIATLRRLYKRGLIPGCQPGGPRSRIVFPVDAIEQMAKAISDHSALPHEATPQTTENPRRGPIPKWMGR